MNSESRVRKPKPLCSKNTACRATGYPAEGVKKKKKKTTTSHHTEKSILGGLMI